MDYVSDEEIERTSEPARFRQLLSGDVIDELQANPHRWAKLAPKASSAAARQTKLRIQEYAIRFGIELKSWRDSDGQWWLLARCTLGPRP